MSITEQQQIQKQRVVHETPPPASLFVQVLPFIFVGFLLFWVAIAIMPIAWDHGGFIGRFVDVLLALLLVGGFLVVVVWMYTFAGRKWNEHYNVMISRGIVQAGDVVIRIKPDGTYDHLSAEHIAAMTLPAPKEPVYEIDYQQRVVQLKKDLGWGRGRIAKELNLPENHVRKILENMGVKEDEF